MNKFVIFSDFDGTITKNDMLDKIIIDTHSWSIYKQGEDDLLTDKISYEQHLNDMFSGITYNLNNLTTDMIDDGFYNFYLWIKSTNIDFYIVSSGFKKIITHLVPYVETNLIFANDIEINNMNEWSVKLFDDVHKCSINKNDIVKLYNKNNHKTVFIGDGLSDFKVMGNVDYLFCKKYSLLHVKCINENYPHIVFTDFNEILVKLKNML
jgi:2,3-diketo-5-methylthio-1-phosphopentane phosphatase